MPRYRKLSVTALDSLDLDAMPDDFTRLTWLMLPLIMTRDGTTYDNPQYLRSKLYPLRDDVTVDQIASAVGCYKTLGMIMPYQVNGRAYLWIPTWAKHQGDTTREGESSLPPPPHSRPTHELLVSESRVNPEQVARDPSTCASTCASIDASMVHTLREGNDSAALAAAHTAWQNARGGAVNAMDAEQVTALCDEYGADWVEAAIHDANAARQDKLPSLNYVKAFLQRWKREGFRAPFDAQAQRTEAQAAQSRVDAASQAEKLRAQSKAFLEMEAAKWEALDAERQERDRQRAAAKSSD
jgi:hypothetical protein